MAPTALPLHCDSVIGTRPGAIQLAPVIKACARREPALPASVARDNMSNQMFDRVARNANRLGVKSVPAEPSNTWLHVLSKTTKRGNFSANV
jgi:hypothetical protein